MARPQIPNRIVVVSAMISDALVVSGAREKVSLSSGHGAAISNAAALSFSLTSAAPIPSSEAMSNEVEAKSGQEE